jgi:hypothetical protein
VRGINPINPSHEWFIRPNVIMIMPITARMILSTAPIFLFIVVSSKVKGFHYIFISTAFPVYSVPFFSTIPSFPGRPCTFDQETIMVAWELTTLGYCLT